jgi:alpha-mannosidase
VIDDPSDTWSHDIKTFADEIGVFGKAEVKPLYDGPLQAIIRVTTTYGKSTLTIDWSLTAGSRRIDADVKLDWHERLKMLKFSFPVDVTEPVPTYESPYGFIVRKPNGDEDPGHRWIDVTGRHDGTTYGLTVINDAKYGYNVAANDLRISVVRSPVYAHHQPKKLLPKAEYEWMDQGIQTFRMALVPHKGSWQEINVTRMAEEFMTPPIPIYQGIHPGKLPKSGSFMEVDAPNVIATAIKKSEEGDDAIIRLVETMGTDTQVTLHFRSAGFRWNGKIKGCEIKTLRLNTNTGEIREVNLLEE